MNALRSYGKAVYWGKTLDSRRSYCDGGQVMTDDPATAGTPGAGIVAADGRPLGRRALLKRSQLLTALRALLGSSRYHDITVAEVARMAGSVPGTFYQYFVNIDDAVRALALEVVESARSLREMVQDADWTPLGREASIDRLVDAFFAFWQDNHSVLRMVDLAALEGDREFRRIRAAMLNGITVRFAAARTSLGPAEEGIDPVAMAGTLVGLLAHVAAHQEGFASWGIDVGDVRASVASLIRGWLRTPPEAVM